MEKYDYYEAVKQDIFNYITSEGVVFKHKANEDLYDVIYDKLWVEDSVTGNASGSYTFNAWQAEENIAHNWDLLEEALSEFGCNNINVIEKGAEWCDVTIRCYLLGQCLSDVLAGIEEEDEPTEEELAWEFIDENRHSFDDAFDCFYYGEYASGHKPTKEWLARNKHLSIEDATYLWVLAFYWCAEESIENALYWKKEQEQK